MSFSSWMDKEDVVHIHCGIFSSVQSLNRVRLFVTPWTTACQTSLSITNSRSLLKLMSIELVMPSSQPSHPLSSPSPPAPNSFQHQSPFQWINSLLINFFFPHVWLKSLQLCWIKHTVPNSSSQGDSNLTISIFSRVGLQPIWINQENWNDQFLFFWV